MLESIDRDIMQYVSTVLAVAGMGILFIVLLIII